MESINHGIFQGISFFPVNPKVKEVKKIHRRRSIIQEFSLNTSTHGIPGIARSESIINRVFWSVTLLTCTGIMFFFIIQAIRAYFEYPTQTTVTITSERQQYFPALTICNAGALRYDTFIKPFTDFVNSLNLTNVSAGNSFVSIQAYLFQIFLPFAVNEGLPIDLYTYSLDTLMMDCQFNSNPCSASDFTSFYSSLYGRCYTFNARTKNDSVRYSYFSSDVSTLVLRLYLYDHQYITWKTEGIAMMAMVHDNTQLPLIERAGMTLAPGFRHLLTYTKKTVYSLPPPYSSCTNDIPLAMKAMFDQYGGADYVYSEDICYILCAQTYIYEKCGCVYPAQWNARSIVLPGTNTVIQASLCNATDPCYPIAKDNFDSMPSLHDEYCSYCSEQCSVTNFIVKPSLSTSPPEWLMDSIKNFVENSPIPLPSNWSSQWREHIRKSYLSIELRGESTLVENYTETASLGFVDVISNVGGQTGLWIGISFLSIMEFIEMFYRFIRYHIYLARGAVNRDLHETPKPDYDIDSVRVGVNEKQLF